MTLHDSTSTFFLGLMHGHDDIKRSFMQERFGLLACFERSVVMQASSRTEWRRYSPAAAAAAALLLAGLLITSQVLTILISCNTMHNTHALCSPDCCPAQSRKASHQPMQRLMAVCRCLETVSGYQRDSVGLIWTD